MPKQPICFYHRADNDGRCSAAIVLKAYGGNVELVGYNYGDEFPFDKVEGRDVIMVDCSLQPFDEMVKLKRLAASLEWIDHHASAIDEANALGFECDGVQFVGKAGCELAWTHYFGAPMPMGVKLLGRYDVWDHKDPKVLPFQYGMQLEDTAPESKVWENIVFNDDWRHQVERVIDRGKIVIAYTTQRDEAMAKSRSFETKFGKLRAICCNVGQQNSQLFDSVWDPKRHDIKVTFQRTPEKEWTVSLYSPKAEVDCGALAKKNGGGGHRGAAGFQCKSLPFEV